MSLHSHIDLRSGERVEIHQSGHGYPPDHTGMAPASCSLWLRHGDRWWRPAHKSPLKVLRDLRQCDSWAEVLDYDVAEAWPDLPSPSRPVTLTA